MNSISGIAGFLTAAGVALASGFAASAAGRSVATMYRANLIRRMVRPRQPEPETKSAKLRRRFKGCR